MEIRWHGRGGQGAKTAALLLGDAMLGAGRYMQAFPEYGPERMGAPVKAYNRVSDRPILLHSGVDSPDVVVVLDASLMGGPTDVTEGLGPSGTVLVNSPEPPDRLRKRMKLEGRRLFTVDATRISQETMGSSHPNTPMLGALVKATGLMDFQAMLESTRAKLQKKFRNKPDAVQGNMNAIERAYQEVQGE